MKSRFPVLESERVVLRQFVASDLEVVFKGLSHPDIIKYYGISYDSLEATLEQTAHQIPVPLFSRSENQFICSFVASKIS